MRENMRNRRPQERPAIRINLRKEIAYIRLLDSSSDTHGI